MNEERVMVITGGSTGLGLELAKHFISNGFRLVLNYFFDKDLEQLHSNNPELANEVKVFVFQADVANREQVKGMFDGAIEKFGRVDILMNFAGINRDAPFSEITDEMWDSVIAAHLKGHFVCGQEYIAHNPDREGLIINIGAVSPMDLDIAKIIPLIIPPIECGKIIFLATSHLVAPNA